MRRTIALSAVAVVVFSGPVAAHPLLGPQIVEPGTSVDLSFNVPVEQAAPGGQQPMVGVTIALPRTFELASFRAGPGWKGARAGSTVRFSGRAAAATLVTYYLSGRFTKAGVVEFPLTFELGDGATVKWDDHLTTYGLSHGSGEHPAPTIWVGVPRVIPPGGPDKGTSPVVWISGGVALAAAAVILYFGFRRRA